MFRARGALIFSAGAMAAAGLMYAMVAVIGSLVQPVTFVPFAILLLMYSAFWHAVGRSHVPAGRERFQARRAWVMRGGVAGLGYFGAVLGVGVLTEMSTPLVHAGVALAGSTTPLAALGYGVGFGLGRALPPWIAVVTGERYRPAVVGLVFVENYRRLRLVGVLASLGGLGFLGERFVGAFR